jgi:hypothetical protein
MVEGGEAMRKWLFISISICLLTILLISSSTTNSSIAAIDKQIKNTSIEQSQQIIGWEYDQINPSTAFSTQSGLFLVVWEDHHWGYGAIWDIYGRMVNLKGEPVGEPFGIAWNDSHHSLHPVVIYNSIQHEFLVVYEFEYVFDDHDIHAQRVDSYGNLIDGEVVITDLPQNEQHPDVIFNPDSDQYLVVWQRWEGDPEFGGNDIYGQRLYPTGSPIGETIPIRVSTDNESTPTVAYLSTQVQYLVMWSDNVGLYPRLKKQWINTDGTLGNYEQNFTVGANYNPSLVANTNFYEYVYVYEDKTYGPPDQIWGYVELINKSGGFGIPITWSSSSDQTNLDVAYNPSAENYTIVWESAYSQSDHDVYMMLFDTYTSHHCCWTSGPFPISYTTSWEGNPAVASSGMVSLIVWEDSRNANPYGLDIYASVRFNGMKYLPFITK